MGVAVAQARRNCPTTLSKRVVERLFGLLGWWND